MFVLPSMRARREILLPVSWGDLVGVEGFILGVGTHGFDEFGSG